MSFIAVKGWLFFIRIQGCHQYIEIVASIKTNVSNKVLVFTYVQNLIIVGEMLLKEPKIKQVDLY